MPILNQLEFEVLDNKFDFLSDIDNEINCAESELLSIQETKESLQKLTPECDRIDYSLAVSSGVLSGIIDLLFGGLDANSKLTKITDEGIGELTKRFAMLNGWQEKAGTKNPLKSAIGCLEKKFKVPYDQVRFPGVPNGGMYPKNHHFKSLGHNVSILGLYSAIVDQFKNESRFVSEAEHLILSNASKSFELEGNTFVSKLYSAIVNWIGHLMSDISGSSGSATRGMGIPSPLWSWINDVNTLKAHLKITPSEFDKVIEQFANKIYREGYDIRFTIGQSIPVVLNELLTRLLYSIRRLIKYLTSSEQLEFGELWDKINPFNNASVKRMLTVSHGTFCTLNLTAASTQLPITTNFIFRLNVVGLGRFGIAVGSEVKQYFTRERVMQSAPNYNQEKIVTNYLAGLRQLRGDYDDEYLISLINSFDQSIASSDRFDASVELANKRKVENGLASKEDIDNYFGGK